MKNILGLIFLAVFPFCVCLSQEKPGGPRSERTPLPGFGENREQLAQDSQGKRKIPFMRTGIPSQRDSHFFRGEKSFSYPPDPFPSVTPNNSDDVEEAWVSHYASGLLPGACFPTDMDIDGQGNIYVTGYCPGMPFGRDYFTIKYDSNGTETWSVRYSEGIDNLARAIALDISGNVYVTGESWISGSSYDYATVKYNSAGVEQWVVHYNGLANFEDAAKALAIDAAGNVYVTGYSWDFASTYDYATVKYTSSGVEQWVARYNGPGNFEDGAAALAVDAFGNVFVTGKSSGAGSEFDYATVKYNSSGIEQWVVRYNGPGNSDDLAVALTVDVSGNFYVTGESEGSGGNQDYATVKYNSAGIEQWVVRYDGPANDHDYATALAVDAQDYVYITGVSRGLGGDYATVKYTSAGAEEWVTRYNGPVNSYDQATGLAVDGQGNVFVTGFSPGTGTSSDFTTIKYNSSGIEQWVARYDGPYNNYDQANSVVVDFQGNVYVTGASEGTSGYQDYATVKYNSAGLEQWVNRSNEPGNSFDEAKAVAIDASGNVYVTGSSESSVTNNDYATVKYDALGGQQWAVRYNGPESQSDEAVSVAVDGVGNVYVTGRSAGVGNIEDYATVKYDASGVEQWAVRYNGPGNLWDEGMAIAVDGAGNVYVTGRSHGSGTEYDYATVKYNAFGEQQWVARYNGPGNWQDQANALAIDGAGNVYVTGTSSGSGTYNDFATVKYDALGVQQWVARYDGQLSFDDGATALALDGAGNVYVTGNSFGGSGGEFDYATVKYNALGVQQWVVRYDGPGNSGNGATALAADASGNVYVTGFSGGSGTDLDYATLKYNASGVQQWVARYNGVGNWEDVAEALAVDVTGNVYVTGRSRNSGGSDDYATVKYDALGVQQWVAHYNSFENAGDGATALAVDASGNVYVTGSSEASDWKVYTTIKYIQTPTGIMEEPTGFPGRFQLLQNYPNPFNPTTTIRYNLPVRGQVTLKIYDVLGREVLTLADKQQREAGYYETVVDMRSYGSGVYFYHITVEGEQRFKDVKKMLLVK